MSIRHLCLTLMFIAGIMLPSQAQTISDEILQMFSPNAAELGKYGKIPVDYFNGLPTIEVPLTTLKAKGEELPVYLTYYAGGHNPEQHPGWVGLGWTLRAGGWLTANSNQDSVASTSSATVATAATSPNRRLFSGKESQSFLSASIPLLDFGARMYDPPTARWTAQDPLAEKYYAVSPYAYCLGNPIIFIDPNGKWITLYHDGHEYRFQDNQFLLYQTEGDYAGSFVPTSDMFIQTISSAFLELSKVETGKSLIDYFSNDKNNAYIQFDDGNNVINLSGICSIIYLNKELTGETVPTEAGMQQMPFWLVVGHELSHRMDYIERGDDASKIWLDVDNGIKNTEIQATHYENLMREEAGLPLRTHYATIGTGQKAMPYEPSRLINRQGKSVILPNVYYTPIRKRK